MLGFHEHKLEFSIIDEYDTYNIVVLDKSLYMESPDLPVLEIQKPNFKEVYRVPFVPDRPNIINSYLLGSDTHNEIPDGIYTFRLAVNPHDQVFVCKNYFRHANLFCKLQKLLLTYNPCDTNCDKSLGNKLMEIFMLIEACKANADKGSKSLANEEYKLALKITENLLKDCK